MAKDAETHAEEDKVKKDLVEARNLSTVLFTKPKSEERQR